MAAPKGNNFNPDGRPRKEVNWVTFEELCAIQCTQSEIASVLKIHTDTLVTKVKEHYEEDYSIVYKRLSESGKSSLRRNQYKLSNKNTAMAIWLGKQWLGQKENNPDIHLSEELNK